MYVSPLSHSPGLYPTLSALVLCHGTESRWLHYERDLEDAVSLYRGGGGGSNFRYTSVTFHTVWFGTFKFAVLHG